MAEASTANVNNLPSQELAKWDGIPEYMDEELPIDLAQLPPIPLRKSLLLVNNYVANTTRFLNHFSSICETKLNTVSNKLTRIEISLSILEAKLESIPDLEYVQVPDSDDLKSGSAMEDAANGAQAPPPLHSPFGEEDENDGISTDSPPPPPPPGDGPEDIDGDMTPNDDNELTLKEDPTYSKYFAMQRLGMPHGAIIHKMTLDGVDPMVLQLGPDAPVSSVVGAAAPSQPDPDVSPDENTIRPAFPPPPPPMIDGDNESDGHENLLQPPPPPPPSFEHEENDVYDDDSNNNTAGPLASPPPPPPPPMDSFEDHEIENHSDVVDNFGAFDAPQPPPPLTLPDNLHHMEEDRDEEQQIRESPSPVGTDPAKSFGLPPPPVPRYGSDDEDDDEQEFDTSFENDGDSFTDSPQLSRPPMGLPPPPIPAIPAHDEEPAVEQSDADGLNDSFTDDEVQPDTVQGDGDGDGADSGSLKLKDDPEFSKYFTMRKLGMPDGAIIQKMMLDGVSPEILDMDPEGPSPNA